ncbi:MAG: hypothetical protein HOM11_08870 [Methylococcales bacterium]|jgi:TPR repeat protein|nr:hypothetical protein [Methylococcales bacterium]
MPSFLLKRWLRELFIGLSCTTALFYLFVDFVIVMLSFEQALTLCGLTAVILAVFAIRHYRYRWKHYLYIEQTSGIKIKQALSYARIGKPEEAIRLLHSIAKEGVPAAQQQLGRLYLTTSDEYKDYALALRWLKSCAKLQPAAQDLLGSMFQYGLGKEQNPIKAMRFYRAAAEQGLASAQCHLGFMWMIGIGVEPVAKTAQYWLLKAAKQNYTPAQNHLGFLYYYGHGLLEDNLKVANSQTGIKKNSKALASLDFLYGDATLPQNYLKAFHWYQRSAMKGNQHAQYYLGLMYEFGQAIPIDEKQAEYWYLQSANQGDKDAIDALHELYDSQKKYFDEGDIKTLIREFKFREVMKVCPACGQKIHLKIPPAKLVVTCVHCQQKSKI